MRKDDVVTEGRQPYISGMIGSTFLNEIVRFGTSSFRYGQLLAALLRHEEEKRKYAPVEAIAAMLEPLFVIFILSIVLTIFERQASPLGGSPIFFLASGLIPKYFFFYISQKMKQMEPKKGYNKRFPIERRLDHIFVSLILRTVDFVFVGILLFGFMGLFITPDAIPHDPVPIIEAIVLIIPFGFFWGVVNMVMIRLFWAWRYVGMAANRIMLIVSGSFFVIDFVPPGTRYVLSFNPMTHALTLFRQGFFYNYPSLMFDKTYLIECSFFAVLLGLLIERVTRRLADR